MKENRKFANVTGYANALPQRSTAGSAGYDIASAEDVTIEPGDIMMVKTGIKAYMNKGGFLGLYPRSSLQKRRLMLSNNVGIADEDYADNENNEGHIHVPLWNFGTEPQHIKVGERLVQGVFQKYYITDDDNATGERTGGFGSTGC